MTCTNTYIKYTSNSKLLMIKTYNFCIAENLMGNKLRYRAYKIQDPQNLIHKIS